MSLTIGSSSYHTAPETKCNLLPCTISKDGDANVTRYFETSVRKENGADLTASFRGRPLNGQEVVLPAGYTAVWELCGELRMPKSKSHLVRMQSLDILPLKPGVGVVLREQGSAVTEDQERLLRVDRRFTSFTSWNLDKPPSADDKLSKAMLWIDIAKALHRPVDEESSQKSVTGK